MFRCFRDSLIKPKFIANHLNMRPIAFIGYIVLLTIFISAPLYIDYYCDNSITESVTAGIVNDLQANTENLPYIIKDNKLHTTSDTAKLTMVHMPSLSTYNDMEIMPIYMIFNPDNATFELNDQLAIFIMLEKTQVSIMMNSGESTTYNPDIQSVAITSNDVMKSYTYEELNANGLDFSSINNYSNYTFQLALLNVVDKMISSYVTVANIVMIPSIFISAILSLLLETLIVTIVVAIFFRMLNIRFGRIFKLTIFCMTPMAVFNILALFPFGVLWSYSFMIIGQLITVVYLFIAIRGVASTNIYNNQQ